MSRSITFLESLSDSEPARTATTARRATRPPRMRAQRASAEEEEEEEDARGGGGADVLADAVIMVDGVVRSGAADEVRASDRIARGRSRSSR